MEDLQTLWGDLETRIGHLLLLTRKSYTDQELGDVRTFVDAREYGLALELICCALAEKTIKPGPEARTEIKQLAALMELDPKKLLSQAG